MTAIVGFRKIPKVKLVLLVPPSVDDAIRATANRTRKSRSEVGSVAIATAMGIDPATLAAPAAGDIPLAS